ncbi:EcsC family protein [Fictibacillus sp. Mic-4]|uniref:EcsC family protein n=1 Tax=Fictibacillus sp. Mic-4 TaxID=3132826 RepID=UPI003CF01268
MSWTPREEKVWQDIENWEARYFTYEPTDFEMTYERWINGQLERMNPGVIEKLNQAIDTSLFHIHSFIQNSRQQMDLRQRLLTGARTFREDIETIEDMKRCTVDQLAFIAEQQIARNRLLSLAQGGLSGTGGLLFLGVDIPALITIQVRSVQYIAMNYGYDIDRPSEMMMSLKVFHAATQPKRYQAESWRQLLEEIQRERDPLFYEGDDTVADLSWMSYPLKQGIKGMAIMLLRKKIVQGIPLFGIAFGAGMNYQQTRTITEFAHKFYQKRFLLEKRG